MQLAITASALVETMFIGGRGQNGVWMVQFHWHNSLDHNILFKNFVVYPVYFVSVCFSLIRGNISYSALNHSLRSYVGCIENFYSLKLGFITRLHLRMQFSLVRM